MEHNKTASFPKRQKYETTFNYETETQHTSFFKEKHDVKYMSNNNNNTIPSISRMNNSSPSSGVNSDGSTLPSRSNTPLSPLSDSMRLSQIELE
jgi:hypothetical protein